MKHINYTLCNNRRAILLDMFARWWLMYLSCFSCSRSVLIPFVFKCEMYFLSFLRQNDKQGKWATVRIPWVTQKWVIIWRKNSTTSILFFFCPVFTLVTRNVTQVIWSESQGSPKSFFPGQVNLVNSSRMSCQVESLV